MIKTLTVLAFITSDVVAQSITQNAVPPLATGVNARDGPGSPSPDGSCGGTNQYICTGTTYGDCCSSSGWCGSTSAHCSASCQTLFGKCPDKDDTASTDGQCGPTGGNQTCPGSGFGICCSMAGFCGSTDSHCTAGCQDDFGSCSEGGNPNLTTDGKCGTNGKSCRGSSFGDCCSSSGFCGKTAAFCDAGCQATFGACNAGASTISTDGSCGENGKTCAGSTFGNCCSGTGFCGSTANYCGQAW